MHWIEKYGPLNLKSLDFTIMGNLQNSIGLAIKSVNAI